MSQTQTIAETTADREMVVSRTFDAPPELVFAAWSDPEHITHWWGPVGFTTTTYEMNMAPGGVWRFVMHGPDGVDYKNRIEYIEVVRPQRLVYLHNGEDEGNPISFHVTVTFDEQGGKTHLTMRAVFETAGIYQHMVKEFGIVDGGNQTLQRLGDYLSTV